MFDLMGERAKSWAVRAILGIVVLTFVISFGYGNFVRTKEVLATVGDHEILVSQFSQQFQDQLELLRRRYPDNAEALAQQLGLRDQVLQQMINRYLMLTAARRLGLQVSEQELRDTVAGQKEFQGGRGFDFETYRAVLRQNDLTPELFESRMQDDLLIRKFQDQLVSGVVVSQAEVDQRYRVESEAVEVEYVTVDPARFDGAVKPDPAAEKAYYTQNRQDFQQIAQYRVKYFVLGIGQLQEAGELNPRAAERYYERNAATEFTTARKVRASHILKRLDRGATPQQAQARRAELEPVLKQARAGADFAGLARKHSDDKAAQGGDLGFFAKEEMPTDFAQAAFSLKVGQVSDIVRTPFGWDIIKVTAEKPEEKKAFAQVRKQIEDKLRTERAEHRLDLETTRLPERIEKEGIEAVAKPFQAAVQETDWLDGTQTLKGLGSTAELYGRLKGRREKAVGSLHRNPVQGNVFFQITAVKDAFTKPFEQVQPQVAARVAQEQRRAAALAEAKAEYAKLKTAADFAAYAKRRGLKTAGATFTVVDSTVPGLGANREFQRAAFHLSAQTPVGISITGNQAWLLRFKRRLTSHPAQEARRKEEIAQQLQRDGEQYFIATELAQLRDRAQVKILIPELLTSPAKGA